jgi:hypothetical protein
LGPHDPNGLLVIVKDGATGLPVTNATVTIQKSGDNFSKATGRGYLSQTDWSGGGAQINYTDQTKYFDSDGNIDNSTAGQISLKNMLGLYSSSGEITSSSFDTGASSNFGEILWQPLVNDPATGSSSLRLQMATSDDPATSTWNYVGPDGTSATYFTSSNYQIPSVLDGKRYFRYKALLSTASSTVSPFMSDTSVTFTSDCVPSGQAYFNDLDSGTWNITVEHGDYQTYVGTVSVGSAWQSYQVNMLSE